VKDETHFLVLRGAKQPNPEHPDPNLVIVPEGPWGNPGSLPFLEFVEDAGSLLSVLSWRDLPVGEQPIDSRKSLLYRLL
jgi:hypothetical protein